MHLQRSKSSLRTLRFASLHFFFNWLLCLVSLTFIVLAILHPSSDWIIRAGIALGSLLFSFLLFFLFYNHWTCPLCKGRIWIKTGCNHNRKSKKFLGLSYRGHVAISTLLRKPYRCPYCGELFSSSKARR